MGGGGGDGGRGVVSAAATIPCTRVLGLVAAALTTCGARWRRQCDERKRGGDATTSRRQRGATRDTWLDERTRDGRLDKRGAAQCERWWHNKRGGDVTTSRHE